MMSKASFLERRQTPKESSSVTIFITALAIILALLFGSLLFLPFGVDPFKAYSTMVELSFGTLRGIGYTLIKATPLIFVGLGTIFAWRSGFFYLGFEGTILIGAAAAVWIALLTDPEGAIGPLPRLLFLLLVFLVSFVAGGIWAGIVGVMRGKFGGNEVILSLMMNFVALFLVNYLVSGPLRAPGDLPQTPRIPQATILDFIIPGTRAHSGILLALFAAIVVWFVLRKTTIGYKQIVAGLSPSAAWYGGINVGNRVILAAFIGGGLGALAGMVEVLGVHFRLLDGLGEGTGFVGIVAALLGKLHSIGVVIASILYAGMEVGADVMQRRAGVPSSVIFVIQSLIVLFILASDILRYYRINLSKLFGNDRGKKTLEIDSST